MKRRIEYIDAIKGFAILLVVMGHVIVNWFNNPVSLFGNDPYNQLMVWKTIYSFHMPLFMFCSGLFQPQLNNESTFKSCIGVIERRFKVLMIPYFASGLMLWLFTGSTGFYWFFLVLFEFILINLGISYLSSRISERWGNMIEISLFVVVFAFFFYLSKNARKYECLPLLDLGHLTQYLYFTAGYLVMKYGYIKHLYHNIVYTIAIIVFGVLFILSFQVIEFKLPLQKTILPFAGIASVFYLFRHAAHNRMWKVFCYMGRFSLEIYVLHFFFLMKVPVIGDTIFQYAQIGGGKITFVLGISISLLMSCQNLFMCYLVWYVIKSSNFLSQLFFGRKYN